jgi:hypothetical protein
MHDIREQINIIWEALHAYREDLIPEGDEQFDEIWDDICTAMAVIQEDLNEPEIADLTQELTTEKEASSFLRALENEGRMIHLDDDPATIVRTYDGTRVFTDDECIHLRKRIEEVFNLIDDPYQECMDISNKKFKARGQA